MEIEQVAEESPDAILKQYMIRAWSGAFQARKIAFALGLSDRRSNPAVKF